MNSDKLITWIYYFALGLLLISLPFSNFMISIAQFILAGLFIIDGISKSDVVDFKNTFKGAARAMWFLPYVVLWIIQGLGRKMKAFFHKENSPAWVLASIYFLHLAGLFFTTDFTYAMKDLRIKLPLLLLPLILSTTGHVDRRAFRFLLYLLIASVTTGTLISSYVLLTGDIADSRDSSLFISHIRFSILIDICIFAIAYLVIKKSEVLKATRVILTLAGVWLVGFLFLAAYMTGIVILIVTSAIMIIYLVLNSRGWKMKTLILSGMMVFLVTGFLYIRNISADVFREEPVDYEALERVTAQGNPYWHNPDDKQVENGHFVWIYVSMDELRASWNMRSGYDFDGQDKAGQEIRYTLIRFLTSKGYRKDAEGVARLTDREVALVEDGIASIVYVERPNLYVRIYKIFWEYKRYQVTHNPSGHSVMQRLEFWRASMTLIRESWVTGVGTGDLENAFQEQYDKMGSLLAREYRWRAHNQFLAITVSFGLFGLAWFLFSLTYPAARLSKFHDYYYLTFFIIIVLSMLTEDTLETQVGVTQFAFFSSFYLFSKKFIDVV